MIMPMIMYSTLATPFTGLTHQGVAASMRHMAAALRYRLTTLGCRVNHAEAREMESLLLERGLVPAGAGEAADVEVVHTCSVTAAAAAKSRHAVRKAVRRRNAAGQAGADRHGSVSVGHTQDPQVIVTGCYASTNAEEATRLAGPRGRVLRHEASDGTVLSRRFTRHLDQWLAGQRPLRPLRTGRCGSCRQTLLPLPVVEPRPRAGSHVRAELKIQDGCDAHCTFCVIPSIRRTLRSKTVGDAVAEACRLVALGHREIVLTGVFIGAYGHETALRRRQKRPGSHGLADLLDAVAQVPGLERLRISSMEPGDMSQALMDAMVANQPVVVPHLHLPLQSGSDAVLRRMNRQYRLGDYLEMIDRVNKALTTDDRLPPAITTDVICGFPGETDEDFEKTVETARRVGFLHMHVFPFSPRPGTAAARWRDRFVDAAMTKSRVRRLIDLEHDPQRGLSLRYRRLLLGRTVRVIIEQADDTAEGVMTGRCDHYAQVWMRTDRRRGSLVHARITEVTPDRLHGRVEPATLSLTCTG